MNKLFAFVARRPGLPVDEFWDHWRAVFAQLLNNRSAHGVERAVENRAISGATVPELTLSIYDGAYEFWFADPTGVTAALLDWRHAIEATAASVNALGSTVVLAAHESVQFDRGTGAVKFMALSRRAASFTTREDWIRYWIEVHGPLAHRIPEFTQYYRRYVHNYIVPTADATGGLDPPWDGIVEEWVDSVDAFAACLAEPKYIELVRPDELRFVDFGNSQLLLVEEHELLRARPVDGSPAEQLTYRP